ncbi:hypothetical protein [Nocardiopsis coralliicola]
MRARCPAAATALIAAAVLALTGCGEDRTLDTARATVGELSSSLLRPKAEQAFERKGHPIAGRLECTADRDNEKAVQVDCAGVTRDEEQAEFTAQMDYSQLAGRDAGDDGLAGRFIGRVAGEEVYVMNCFSCKPSPAEASTEAEAKEKREKEKAEESGQGAQEGPGSPGA